MSTLLMSLLLIVLIGLGLIMGRSVSEKFENPTAATATITVSPALANLLATPDLAAAAARKPIPQIDTLAREQEAVAVQEMAAKKAEKECPQHECPKCPECKKCPDCPDMSQYIRMDEVPCWNCTLP
jgi:hypothetical protein